MAAVIWEGEVDRPAKIAELESQLAKVMKNIAEEERVEKRLALIQSAFGKLKAELLRTLTPEEREAVNGAYLFLHTGGVDLVRRIPSPTSKGEDRKLEKDLNSKAGKEEPPDAR